MIKNNMNMDVWVVSFGDDSVLHGKLIDTAIMNTGYIKHTILIDDKEYMQDDNLVFDNEAEANAALEEFKPFNEAIKAKQKECNESIDYLREQIIGKPHFPEYIKGE